MPNIVSQPVNADGLHVVASDGSSVTVTAARIKSEHDATADGPLRVQTVERWLAGLIADALGEQNVEASQIEVRYDPETGAPELTVYS